MIMGGGRFDSASYSSYSEKAKTRSVAEVFTQRTVHRELDVSEITVRESCDGPDNPCSTPIIIGLDVTGSMGRYAKLLAAEKLGILVGEILQRKPVTDPHLMFLGIGDCTARDRHPLQATQFEADNRIVNQLTNIYLEGGGGANDYESYDLAWLFAACRTKTDAWDKRKEKGYLFTIGDELFPQACNHDYAKKVLGDDCPQDTSPLASLEKASERYHVFHVIVEQGGYARGSEQSVYADWKQHLGLRTLRLNNADYISEVIVTAIAIENGVDPETAITQWPQNAQPTLRRALSANELASA
jgi:hypothetical protein